MSAWDAAVNADQRSALHHMIEHLEHSPDVFAHLTIP